MVPCKGLNRVHQFDKVEIVRIENLKTPGMLNTMVRHVAQLMENLELPLSYP